MKSSEKRDRFFQFLSWLVVAALVYAALTLWVFPPAANGPVAQAVGIVGSQVFYAALYLGEAISLAYAKLKKRNKWRKNTLLVIYLTGFFTSLLTIALSGISIKLLDNLIISVAAAACWLYWTFKTEYLTAQQFEEYNESQG